jgi:hypothetical protein
VLFPVAGNGPTSAAVLHAAMNMWISHIGSGHHLSNKPRVQQKTLSIYLRAAADISRIFDPLRRDPRMDGDRIHPDLTRRLANHGRLDTMPSRVNPYTLAMHTLLVADAATAPADSLTRALASWLGAALMGGNRRIEWAQPQTYRELGIYQRNPFNECYAFTVNDVRFYTANRRPIPTDQAIIHRADVARVSVTYRWQKNKVHGEVKQYTVNTDTPECCAVASYLDICARWKRLQGHPSAPLAIYRAPRGTVAHITEADISSTIRSLASRTLGITDPTDLQRWTSHSLRVGACVILWSHGRSGEFIQRALRWRGDSWKDYVREVPQHAEAHNASINAMMDTPVW